MVRSEGPESGLDVRDRNAELHGAERAGHGGIDVADHHHADRTWVGLEQCCSYAVRIRPVCAPCVPEPTPR